MVSGKLKELFGNVKERLGERLSEIKPKDIAKFATKEAVAAIPVIGPIIKDAFEEFSEDEKEELIKELKELSESQFKEISQKVGFSVEYLKDIREITLYTFGEIQADHEEIKKLLLHLIEIVTQEVELKPPKITIPTIQSVLRKGETFEGDFFKKEPEWGDFEEGFIVERKEVDGIIKKLESDNIQLVLGEPASGKSVILKNIGFKLAKEHKAVYIVELKKHSRDEVQRYFDDILRSNDEKAVFIVDDAHLQLAECERLVRDFKNRKLKAKLIVGSRPIREIRGEHPKEASVFEHLSKTYIHAEDVTEEMIKTFLKKEHQFSDERIKTVSENLERYKKDLWHLSWALKTYNPKKDIVEEKEIYEKIRDSIRDINAGKDKTRINAEDVFLPLSIFYQFEIPVVKDFLEELLEIEKDKINKLIGLSEIIETEEIGKNRTLSLIHSSIADLYLKAYWAYPSLGERSKEEILEQKDEDLLQYCLFYKYMTSTDPRNAIDVVIQLGGDCFMEKGGRTLLEQLIEDGKIQKSIKKGIVKEENIGKVGWCARYIAGANKEVAREIVSCINIDTLSSKIKTEEDASGNIVFCVVGIAAASKEAGLKLVDSVLKRIEIEEDIRMIGWCLGGIAVASEGVAREIVNRINVDVLLTKIEKEEDIGKIGWCVEGIAAASEEVAQEIINRLNPKIREELQKSGWLK